jgi:hypothetical protein
MSLLAWSNVSTAMSTDLDLKWLHLSEENFCFDK